MLNNILTLYTQILVMFLLMFAGFTAYHLGIINDDGSKQMSSLLVKIVAPAVIINAFGRAFDAKLAALLLTTFLVSMSIFAMAILVSSLVFPQKSSPNWADRRMCVIFANNGFMALPLLDAVFGSLGVFLGSVNIVANNLFLWTYGVKILSPAKTKSNIRQIVLNPGTVSLFFGLLLFCSPVKLPLPLSRTVEYLASLNTPLAMIVLGVYLAQSDLLNCLRDKGMYLISFYKLILVPLLAFIFLMLIPFDDTARQVLIISTSAPSAVAAPMFAQVYGTDYLYSSRVVAVTTLLSALTMPILLALHGVFL